MPRKRTIGGGSLKSGFGGYSSGGSQTFKGLTDTPNSYVGEAGKVVIVNPGETGLVFDTEAAIDRHDVKASATDATPDFLDAKVDGKTIGVASDKLYAITKWMNPAISFYNNTTGTPSGAAVGDRHIAMATASGWTINYIYEWSGAAWVDTAPAAGMGIYVKDIGDVFTYNANKAGWIPDYFIRPVNGFFDPTAALPVGPAIGDRYIASATGSGWGVYSIYEWDGTNWIYMQPERGMVVVNLTDSCLYVKGGVTTPPSWDVMLPTHAFAGASHSADTITNLNTKLSDGAVISTKANEIASIAAKATPITADFLLIEDSADTNKKKSITIGTLPAAAPAAHALAGALHTADTITNLDSLLSDGDVISTKAAEISAIAAKATPITADFLLIEDSADTNKKKSITIGTLPAAAPAAHAFAGALHSADTITNMNTLLSDGDVISTKAGEIAAMTPKVTPVNADYLVIEDSADANKKKSITIGDLPIPVAISYAQIMTRILTGG